MPKEKTNKKPNFFKRIWDKIGSRGRIALASVAYLGLWAVPFSAPIQFGCLAVIVYESKAAQQLIARIRRRFPKFTEKLVAKVMKSKYAPKILKDVLHKTDPKVFFADKNKSANPFVQIKRDFSESIKKAMDYRNKYRAEKTKAPTKKTIVKNKLVADIISKRNSR